MLVSLRREAGRGVCGSGQVVRCHAGSNIVSHIQKRKRSVQVLPRRCRSFETFFAIRRKKMEVFIRNLVQKHDDDVINGHHRDHQSGLDGDDDEVT